MLLFRLLAWPTLLFSSRTWDLQAWNAVVQLIPTGWGRKLPEIWGNETYQPAIASCDATEYESLSVCPIDKLVKHPYLHFTCQVAKYPIWNIQTYHLLYHSLWELDLFQWLRGIGLHLIPFPNFSGTPSGMWHSNLHQCAGHHLHRQQWLLPPAFAASDAILVAREQQLPPISTDEAQGMALWPLKQICWGFGFCHLSEFAIGRDSW